MSQHNAGSFHFSDTQHQTQSATQGVRQLTPEGGLIWSVDHENQRDRLPRREGAYEELKLLDALRGDTDSAGLCINPSSDSAAGVEPVQTQHHSLSANRAAAPYRLTDQELVRFVTGTKANEARELVRKFGGASAVIGASDSDMAVQRIDRATARRIRSFQEAAAAYHWRKATERLALNSWNALLDYLSVGMAAKSTEEFHVLFLDRRNALIADEVMGKGTVDHTPVYPREVLKRALVLDASAIVLAHNHPSGDPTPSRADINMTREVVEACTALRIAVHDHVVVGRTGTVSLKALGLM